MDKLLLADQLRPVPGSEILEKTQNGRSWSLPSTPKPQNYAGNDVLALSFHPRKIIFFDTDFFLSYQADQDYTFRSQYLKNITLSGGSAANIFGNTFINELNGNEGNNHFQGFEGDDFINGGEGQDRAIYQGNLEEYF